MEMKEATRERRPKAGNKTELLERLNYEGKHGRNYERQNVRMKNSFKKTEKKE